MPGRVPASIPHRRYQQDRAPIGVNDSSHTVAVNGQQKQVKDPVADTEVQVTASMWIYASKALTWKVLGTQCRSVDSAGACH